MKKKLVLICVALLIFYMPFSITHQEVNAVAVASKVVNASAKKVAKEVAVDTAVNMSMNFVMDYKYTPKDTSKKPKEGFSFVCMPKDKSSDGGCSKPLEVKTNLSADDKRSLSTKVEANLDKKIAGGIGATRFGKFLDWFVPIFSIGMGVAVIDYAMDGEVSDLFDDLAFDSLAELGLISTGETTTYDDNISVPKHLLVTDGVKYVGNDTYGVAYSLKDPSLGSMYHISDGNRYTVQVFRYNVGIYGQGYISTYAGGSHSYIGEITQHGFDPVTVMEKFVWNGESYGGPEVQQFVETYGRSTNAKIYYHDNATGTDSNFEVPLMPKFYELNTPRTNQANKPIKIVAPGGLPYTEISTGEELLPYPKPDGTTGFKTRTGTEVPEDNVNVGNPKVTENPDGSKTVVKTPTVSSPNPSPSENGTIPKTPTDTDAPITEEELGNSCTRLKKPDFKPLTNAFTTSFPFSIPWDLQRLFQSAFSEIGSDEPSFEYKFDFNGQQKTWKIEFPDYFADWTKFVRPLLLIIFDIGLIYAIYRFTKGGGD